MGGRERYLLMLSTFLYQPLLQCRKLDVRHTTDQHLIVFLHFSFNAKHSICTCHLHGFLRFHNKLVAVGINGTIKQLLVNKDNNSANKEKSDFSHRKSHFLLYQSSNLLSGYYLPYPVYFITFTRLPFCISMMFRPFCIPLRRIPLTL